MKKRGRQTISMEGIPVEVTFKAIKNMYLRVVPPLGEIRISAPRETPMETVRQFALSKRQWILRKRLSQAEEIPASPFRYMDGVGCTLWGREYHLRTEEGAGKEGVELDGSDLIVHALPGAPEGQKKEILHRWRKEQLFRAVELLLSRWEPRMGLKVASVSLRQMKTRWGSCTPSKRTIRLNTALASVPEELLEYVLVHEMAHIRQSNHSPLFWSIVGEHLPGWRNSRKRLRAYSPEKA